MKVTLYFTFLFFISFQLTAQKDKPIDSEIQFAKELKEKYEDEDVVISEKTIQISFTRNSTTGKVEVKEEKSVTFLAIAKRADLGYSSGYDNESEIEKLKLYDRRGKKVGWNLNDEAYSSSSIFHNDYRIRYGEINLPLQGYIRRIDEVKIYKDVKYFTTEYFKNRYPTLKGKLIINIPDWLVFDTKEFHFKDYKIEKTELKNNDERVITYTYNDIPAVKKEAGMPGSSFLHPHIVYLPQSYTNNNGEISRLFKDTQDLYNWYAQLIKSVEIDTSEIKIKVNQITEGLSTDEEKIKALYYWVQDKIKYIAFADGIAGFKPDSPQNVLNKKYGDCKGMAILLKTMLVEAGYDAKLVWIGTDNIAYDYSIPSLIVDNHMITALLLNGETIFLDGTEKFNAFGSFASRIQGKQALIENGDTFILQKIPVTQPEFNSETYQGQFTIEGDDVIGKVQKELTGEQVSSFLYGFNNVPSDKKEDALGMILTEGNDNAKIENVTGFDSSNRDDVIRLDYDVKLSNTVSKFDNNLYLELDPIKYLYNWSLEEDRENSYQFRNTRLENKTIQLELPEGYTVEALPSPIRIENELLLVDASYYISENTVYYTSSIKIKQRMITKDKFELWNESIKKIKTFYDEQVVLIKS